MQFALQYFIDLMGMVANREAPPYQPLWFPMFMSPETGRTQESTFFLTWKTEEIEAKTPKKLDEVKDKVAAAWKRLKAQKLAADAANALQKEVRDAAIRDKAALAHFALSHKTELIELEPLAKRVGSRPSFQPGLPPSRLPPQTPTDQGDFPP